MAMMIMTASSRTWFGYDDGDDDDEHDNDNDEADYSGIVNDLVRRLCRWRQS